MIAITSFRDENYFLSNMFPQEIHVGSHTFSCAESLWHAIKCYYLPIGPTQWRDMIEHLKICDGFQAKKFMKPWRYSTKQETHFSTTGRILRMEQVQHMKYRSRLLRSYLLKTGDRMLIEGNDWGDKFWGMVKEHGQWVGANHLGQIIMRERHVIQHYDDPWMVNGAIEKALQDILPGITETPAYMA